MELVKLKSITIQGRVKEQTYGPVWECISTFAEKDIPKAAKFRWNPERKRWWTDDPTKAMLLREYASGDIQDELNAIKKGHTEALKASRATDAEIEIPCPDGLAYFPFQKAGIHYTRDKKSVLYGDEMGLGKSIEALGVINLEDSIKKVLIICPASLRINWRNEATKWLTRPFTIGMADTKTLPDTDIIIAHYDIWSRQSFVGDALLERIFDLVIIDEAHLLKSYKSIRCQKIYGKNGKGGIQAKRKIALTGTPIPNRPSEIFSTLNYLDAKSWPSFWNFAKRFCDLQHNRFGYDFTGASNLNELQDKLRSTILLRRLKKDVLTELPPKIRQIIEIPANGISNVVEAEQNAYERHENKLEELRITVELAKASDNEEEYKNAVKELREASQVAFTEMARLRHDTAVAKIPFVIEHINNISGKVVVFIHHHDVADALLNEFKKEAVILDGRLKLDERQNAVDMFQNDPGVRVFIGGIHAAGVGITLTASSHVVFAELDWVPSNITQAESRLHRIGQNDHVLVQHLVLEDSLDAKMAKTIVAKQEVIDKALDDDTTIEIPSLPEEPTTYSRNKIQEIANELTEIEIETIHAALQRLSAMCDGAMQLDGTGFNKFDSHIGKSLAGAPILTPKQAALGRRICRKYHNQLPEEWNAIIKGEK